jgi:cell division protein FtsN
VPAPAPVLVTPLAPRPTGSAAAATSTGRVARIVTPDWSGKETIYVIHFSSYKDRPSAEKEARSLGGRLDHPGYAVQVDRGEKGTWYRVLIGDFDSAEAARAYRAELEAKRTPNMGFVYRLEGK